MLGLGDRLQLLDLFDAVHARRRGRRAGAFCRALRAGCRPGGSGAGSARDQPLAVAPEGRAEATSSLGIPAPRPRAPRPWRRNCPCRRWRALGRCCSRASTRSDARPGRRSRGGDGAAAPRCVSELPRPANWRGCCATARPAATSRRTDRGTRARRLAPTAGRSCAAPKRPSRRLTSRRFGCRSRTATGHRRSSPGLLTRFATAARHRWPPGCMQSAHLIRFEPGHLELRFAGGRAAPTSPAGRRGGCADDRAALDRRSSAARRASRRWRRRRRRQRCSAWPSSAQRSGAAAGPGRLPGARPVDVGVAASRPRDAPLTAEDDVRHEELGQHAQGSAEAAVAR